MGRFSFASRRSSPLRRRTQGRDGARPAVVVDEVRPHAEATSEACLESPVTGGAQPGFAIALAGWALGLGAAIRTIEVVAEGSVHARVPVDGARPDVGSAHPGIPHADRSGFRGAIGALDLPQRFELILEAVVEDGTRSPLWTVRGRREPVLEPRAHGLRPIVIRCTGRTGSTFLTRLLDQHPQVIVYRPFEYEPRILSYWIEILRSLADPRAGLTALRPSATTGLWWLGDGSQPEPLPPEDEPLAEALCRDDIRAFAAFARGRIDAFYATLAAHAGKRAVAFAEKGAINDARFEPRSRLIQELYPDAREILLVRDPRDMLCSMLAYDARRGATAFGRSGHDDAQWTQWLGHVLVEMTRAHRALGERSLLVRYEDLVAEPREVMRAVFSHLGLDAAADLLERVIDRASEEHPAMAAHRTGGDAASDSVGRWRREMPPALRRHADAAFAEVLSLDGYEVDA